MPHGALRRPGAEHCDSTGPRGRGFPHYKEGSSWLQLAASVRLWSLRPQQASEGMRLPFLGLPLKAVWTTAERRPQVQGRDASAFVEHLHPGGLCKAQVCPVLKALFLHLQLRFEQSGSPNSGKSADAALLTWPSRC